MGFLVLHLHSTTILLFDLPTLKHSTVTVVKVLSEALKCPLVKRCNDHSSKIHFYQDPKAKLTAVLRFKGISK